MELSKISLVPDLDWIRRIIAPGTLDLSMLPEKDYDRVRCSEYQARWEQVGQYLNSFPHNTSAFSRSLGSIGRGYDRGLGDHVPKSRPENYVLS
jgi:hypothetical protein